MIPRNESSEKNVIVFGTVNVFRYTNCKGETEVRQFIPVCLSFRSTPHHPEPQWMLECLCPEKEGVYRTFALKDIHPY